MVTIQHKKFRTMFLNAERHEMHDNAAVTCTTILNIHSRTTELLLDKSKLTTICDVVVVRELSHLLAYHAAVSLL
jgi:hypothetical protein